MQRHSSQHLAKLKELCERWDKHIADLDVINERLEEQYQNSAPLCFTPAHGRTKGCKTKRFYFTD